MPTLTTSYQYLGYSPENGPNIMSNGSYHSKLYLQVKVKSYNSTTATITARASIRNSWVGWSSYNVKIALTGKSTHPFINYGPSSKWTGASATSGSSSYKEVWSDTYDFDVSYGDFQLGLDLGKSDSGSSAGMGYTASIAKQTCTVVSPEPTSWTVSYNANGGTGAPANQTKTKDVTLTLSSTTPTRASETTTGATVTFSDSVGTPAYSTYTTVGATVSYTFDHWNTKQDDSGTSYSPGGSYTANEAATLYAQWSTGSQTDGKVQLPQSVMPTMGQGKYFVGWTTVNGDESTLVQNGYVATSNITLYALWKNVDSAVKYRTVGGSWINF